MAMIEFEEGAIQVDVTVVAKGLRLEPSLIQKRMREGTITSLCERGIDDEGRYRLSFFSENRRLRLVVDDEGSVVQSSAIDFGDRGLPASARKPGA
jgi:hypothetical protein